MGGTLRLLHFNQILDFRLTINFANRFLNHLLFEVRLDRPPDDDAIDFVFQEHVLSIQVRVASQGFVQSEQ